MIRAFFIHSKSLEKIYHFFIGRLYLSFILSITIMLKGWCCQMRNAMKTWGRIVVKIRWVIVVLWVVLAVIGGMNMSKLSPLLTGGGWEAPDSDSEKASNLIEKHYDRKGQTSLSIVLKDARHKVGSTQYTENLNEMKKVLEDDKDIKKVFLWSDASTQTKNQFVGDDDHTTLGVIDMDMDEGFAQKVLPNIQEKVKKKAEELHINAVILGSPALWGEVNVISQEGLHKAHLYALPIILIVLLFVFRSVISALTPLIVALTSIGVSMEVLYFFAQKTELSTFVLDSAMMIGLGVGIDFSLIYVMRFKEELTTAEGRVTEAIETTMATAGRAILFSGLTILGAISSILFVDIPAVRSIAIGVLTVVFLLLMTSLSLLPAVLSLLGKRVHSLKISFAKDKKHKRAWYNFTHKVMKKPIIGLVAGVCVLLALAWPAIQLTTSTPDVRMLPESSTVRKGVEMVEHQFGKGATSPIQIVIYSKDKDLLAEENIKEIKALEQQLKKKKHVDSVSSVFSFFDGMDNAMIASILKDGRKQIPDGTAQVLDDYINKQNNTVAIKVMSDSYASSGATKQLVEDIRTDIIPSTKLSKDKKIEIATGGETAAGLDTSDSLKNSLIHVTLITLGFIFIILVITFRSLLLPLKAICFNLLSLGATYGVLIIVFQWGLGSDIFGFGDFGYIQNFVPILLLGLLFSLSTDYEVFLIERMKEEFEKGHSNEESVALGLEKTAPMISGAALIMVAVFTSFAFAGILPMQQLGLGMAVAIALDATLIRLILVPAAMKLLGKWTWWLPGAKQMKHGPHERQLRP